MNDTSSWQDILANKSFKEIKLEIYSDEIWCVESPEDHSLWMYLGSLFVPLESKEHYLKMLTNLRCIGSNEWKQNKIDCTHSCKYHERNDTEIHYKDLDRSNARFKIADSWVRKVINRVGAGDNKLYINILGLNLSNMNMSSFGKNKTNDMIIYNRFYRTLLLSGLNYFFKNYEKITINKIYHDNGGQSHDNLFPWHSIHKINLDSNKINILDNIIKFLESDHRNSKRAESNFIQLIDLALGATYCLLHDPSKKEYKIKIGQAFEPTLKILLDRKRASNSNALYGDYYNSRYYRTYQVSFFPKDKIDPDNVVEQLDVFGDHSGDLTKRDNFYYNRKILQRGKVQTSLEGWFEKTKHI